MRAVLLELVQFVPIVLFAAPFLVEGQVDLSAAGQAFVMSALTAMIILWRTWRMGFPLNPILVGADAWLFVGALAFSIPLPPIVAAIAQSQGFGLFVAILVALAVATAAGPRGAVGVVGDSPRIRLASLGLLVLAVLLTAWAFLWRHDLRIGGGLPFVLMNVSRRALGVWLQRSSVTGR